MRSKFAASREAAPKSWVAAATCLSTLWLCALGVSSTETAVANGDTRTIRLHHAHTNESIEATYRVNGQYDPAVLEKLNWFLRDWRREEATKMDPRLFDAVWEAYRGAGATDPIVVVCGYRSPQTNAMLRSRSRGVAEHSQHMLGKAMDTTMPGMSMERVREVAMRMQLGGVGYYGASNFVHIDVGGVRSWPRMSYDQLSRLFPDGKTVHIPSNGQPLARYEEARAEIQARGSEVDVPPSSQGPNFFAWLFGSGHSEDEREEVASASIERTPTRVALRGRMAPADSRPDNRPTAVASLAEDQDRTQKPRDRVAEKAAEKTVVASLVPPRNGRAAAVDLTPAADAEKALPLPPARPVEIASLDDDIPLPPLRPAASVGLVAATPPAALLAPPASEAAPTPPKVDAIGNLISATNAATPARVANLPDLITQGTATTAKTAPTAVLAYAAGVQIEGLRSAARNKKAGLSAHVAFATQPPPPMIPARLDHSNFLVMTGPVETAHLSSQTVLGPTIAGLRQVARSELRIQAGTLTNVALSTQPIRFRIAATELPTDRFVDASGIAYANLSPGADRVHVVVGSLALKSGE